MKKWGKLLIVLFLVVIIIVILVFKLQKNTDTTIKNYKDEILSFDYSSRFNLKKNDNYLELIDDNANIIFEYKKISTVENGYSFDTLVDNIVFNYLNNAKDYKLISQKNNYKFKNNEGYRLIFENDVTKENSMVLIGLSELNLTMVTLNAKQNEFSLLVDSAELIMNTLKYNNEYKYLEIQEKDVETSDIELDSDKRENLKYSDKNVDYEFVEEEFRYKISLPENFKQDGYKPEFTYDKTNIKFSIGFIPDICEEACITSGKKKGYVKYNDEIYYTEQQDWTIREYLVIYKFLGFDKTLRITIGSDFHITKEFLDMLTKNLSITKDQKGIITIEDNKIKGKIYKDNVSVTYSLNNKNYERTIDGTENVTFYGKASTELKLTKTKSIEEETKYNNLNMYTSYSIKKIGNVQISGYNFIKYVEEYTSTFDLKYYKEYYIYKVNESLNLIIEIDEHIQDINDINLEIQVKN